LLLKSKLNAIITILKQPKMSNRIHNNYIDPQIRAFRWDVLRVNIEHHQLMKRIEEHNPDDVSASIIAMHQQAIDRYTDELISLMN
jgi:DNA-binding GntR family transcriptional regulator